MILVKFVVFLPFLILPPAWLAFHDSHRRRVNWSPPYQPHHNFFIVRAGPGVIAEADQNILSLLASPIKLDACILCSPVVQESSLFQLGSD